MFKKKATLPARPVHPKNAEIFEDLANANDHDVVFTLIPISTSKFPNIVNASSVQKQSDGGMQSDESELGSPESSYRKMKTFDEKVEYTERNIEILKDQHQKLSEIKQNLLEDIEKVKKACS